MPRKSPNIPDTRALDEQTRKIVDPIKAQLEIITGRSVPEIELLPATATTAQIVAKINEIINRLQN